MGKTEKWENIFWVTKPGNKGLQTGAGFRDFKSGNEGLQIGEAFGISNRGKKITNRGKEISKRSTDYKPV